MVQLNSLSVVNPPLVDSANGETEVTLSWNAVATQPGDNPVTVNLKISPFQDIAFVSTKNAKVAEVECKQNFEVNVNKDYSETVVVIVKRPQGDAPEAASIKMTITSAKGGTPSDEKVELNYK